jgi:hypothetical protein
MCKCGGKSYQAHLAKVAAGYPGHVFSGFVWIVR